MQIHPDSLLLDAMMGNLEAVAMIRKILLKEAKDGGSDPTGIQRAGGPSDQLGGGQGSVPGGDTAKV